MKNFLDDFFSSYSEEIEKNRTNNLKRINNCYEIANSIKKSLFEEYLRVSGPVRKYQNPVVHSRIDFKGSSSIYSLREDITVLIEEGKIELKPISELVEDDRIFMSFEIPDWVSFECEEECIIIECLIPVPGYVSSNVYSYPRTSIIKSSLDGEKLNSVFVLNGEVKSGNFMHVHEDFYELEDIKIKYDPETGTSEMEI